MENIEIKKNSNKGLIILIIILFIMVLGLGGYVIYDKLLTNDSKETTTSNNSENKDREEQKSISESEALTIGNELWKYAYSTFWGTEPAWTNHPSDTPNQYGGIENICDTTIEQVKSKYASDFKAQSCYSDGTTCADYTIDNFVSEVACQGAGRGGIQDYKDTSLTVKSIQDNKIVFTAKSEYCGSSFCHESNETVKEVEKDFVIVKQNDNWLISSFYLPD